MENLIILTGPTASGKTGLSIKIAEKKGFEIISADSRQVYRYMNIGTAKITPDEMKGIKHHLIDIVLPDERYSAFMFSRDAEKILKSSRNVMIVGGSLFYISALVESALAAPFVDEKLRDEVQREYEENPELLYDELCSRDPVLREKIHKNDEYRVVRAISVMRSTGKPYSEYKKSNKPGGGYRPLYYIIDITREELYRRINRRVEKMIEAGLFEEVENILNMGFEKNLRSFNTPGYREVIDYVEGRINKDQCVSTIKSETRKFAKRQLSWIRSLEVKPVSSDNILKSF